MAALFLWCLRVGGLLWMDVGDKHNFIQFDEVLELHPYRIRSDRNASNGKAAIPMIINKILNNL